MVKNSVVIYAGQDCVCSLGNAVPLLALQDTIWSQVGVGDPTPGYIYPPELPACIAEGCRKPHSLGILFRYHPTAIMQFCGRCLQ